MVEDEKQAELEATEERDASEAALEHPSYEELEAKLTEAEKNAHENWDKYLRTQAEFDNYRRRTEKDITNAHKYGQEKLVQELLPIVDSLELALSNSNQETHKTMREGIELTLKLFNDTLQKFGIKPLNPAGEKFDPHYHQAISMLESEEVESGHVISVVQKGYLLHDRVIRPALVTVAN